jgi:hypothetical protein
VQFAESPEIEMSYEKDVENDAVGTCDIRAGGMRNRPHGHGAARDEFERLS